MAVYYPSCSTTITRPACTPCETKESGDVRSFALVKKTFAFTDISSTAEWTTGINAEDIYTFPFSKGTVAAAENMEPGFGDQEETLSGYTYTATVETSTYKNDADFWNDIKNRNDFKLVYRTENYVHETDVAVTIIPKADVKEGKRSRVNWMITFKWTQDNLVLPQDMPAGVFDRCIDIE